MKSFGFVFILFVIQSCATLEFAHTMQCPPNWQRTETKRKYDPYAGNQQRLTFAHVLETGDTLIVNTSVFLQGILCGPLVPVLPNLGLVHKCVSDYYSIYVRHLSKDRRSFIDTATIHIEGIGRKPIAISLIKYNSSEPSDSRVFIRLLHRRKSTKCLVINIEEVSINGVKYRVPPLLLQHKRRLLYVPLIHPFLYR